MPKTVTQEADEKNKNWLKILALGRYAPTPHNTQWYFVHPIDDTTAEVGIDSSIQLPYTDPDDQFRFTGLGVFVRHLELSAEAVGFALEIEFNTTDANFPVTARITSINPPNEHLAKLITQRRTSRLAYQKHPISDDACHTLTSLSDAKLIVHVSSKDEIVESVLDLNNKVLLNDLQHKGVGDELDRWTRYTKRSQSKHRSGFTPATLGVPAWKAWLVLHMRKIMLLGPMKKWLTSQYFEQNTAGTVGWLYGPLDTQQNQYDAGRFMMDLWMSVTELGYYMQPYGSIITNTAARLVFLQEVGQKETDGNMVWLAFRIGISNKPAASPRRSIEEFIR